MALHLLFGSLELVCGYTAGAVMGVLCLRLAIMVSLTAFSWMTLDKKFHRVMDALTLGFYSVGQLALCRGSLVAGAVSLLTWFEYSAAPKFSRSDYLFFGRPC